MYFFNFIIAFFFLVLNLQAEIDKKYQTNVNCKACHLDISTKWETSRHAHSHFTKNELYNNVLEYIVAKDVVGTKEEVVIECAKCHNPRIQKREVTDVEKIEMLLDIDKETMDKMINAAYMQNGINCIVCHNVEKIEQNSSTVGFDAVKFGPQGVMYGPFSGAKSPYHFTQKRDFFKKDPNKLCMVCHLMGKNTKGLKVYSTGQEYLAYAQDLNKTLPTCVECHMSKEKSGIASNYGGKGGRVPRMVRDHLFASIDNSKMYKKYIDMEAKIKENDLFVRVINKAPHKLPTGYGLREVAILITFYDKQEKKIDQREYSFSINWLDKDGKITIPHLAVKMGEDNRLLPGGHKDFLFSIPKETKIINYKLIYRQVKKQMLKELKIKDKFFKKDYILKNGVLEY
jgi:hypothetical protein